MYTENAVWRHMYVTTSFQNHPGDSSVQIYGIRHMELRERFKERDK